ncbi:MULTISPECIES: type II methionyl aminopeptidase [Methanobacterium]|uniref:Methionine aminopeptidase n=1 Tax=Methanobacterium bryantii TaxID=2161 RepID=A0A2A2H6R8_METBR|nr:MULTISPECIES: type II methionyl aminopeptidase [Methanobacterium]OEC85892.1 type II methionyl aminopeptidase [Methanobacterium sp. A39]PAV04953.1 methionine aminopeptidase [Methanobacterium bryantii]
MIDMYKKSGKIASKIRKDAVNYVKEDMKVLDLVEFVENEIVERGGNIAFPCNVSVNEITAHYTSPAGDENTIKSGDVVKIDLGVHIDGYIADTAVSVLVGEDMHEELREKHENMILASQEGLENGISSIRAGVEIGKVGEIIEKTINDRGFNVVSNLTGHSMDQWILHAGLSMPNIKENNPHKLEEGDVLAIEPFATDGIGRVTDMNETYIFKFLRDRPMRLVHARRALKIIKEEYKSLPFSGRWLTSHLSEHHLNAAMRMLISSRAVYPYHVLREKSNAVVAQSEHTVIVESDGCTVITE